MTDTYRVADRSPYVLQALAEGVYICREQPCCLQPPQQPCCTRPHQSSPLLLHRCCATGASRRDAAQLPPAALQPPPPEPSAANPLDPAALAAHLRVPELHAPPTRPAGYPSRATQSGCLTAELL